MLYTDAETAAPAIAQILTGKQHVLLITHVNPDGDAIGSLLGLGLSLEARGHAVTLLAPTPLPLYVTRLGGVERIEVYSKSAVYSEIMALPASVDLIMLVDTGDIRRIARIYEENPTYVDGRPLVVIDHHATNSGEGQVNLVDASLSSTCELLYRLLRAWNASISAHVATALLMGVITDTQSFKTSNTTPSALRTAADLIELGADRELIMRDVYSNIRFETAKLLSLSLSELRRDGPLAWTHVTQVMQRSVGADDDASAEVTEYIAGLGGLRATALFKERRDGSVKVSLRSVPGVDVAAVAQHFGGGGHRQAAGATLAGPLHEAEERLLAVLRAAVGEPENEQHV